MASRLIETVKALAYRMDYDAMTEAFVFVNCLLTMTGVVEHLASITKGVLEAHQTSGVYDLVLKVSAPNEVLLRDTISKIKCIEGVTSTLTSIIGKK